MSHLNRNTLSIFLFLFLLIGGMEIAHAKDETRVLVLLSLDITYPYVKSKVDGLGYEAARNSGTILLDIQTLEDERYTDPKKLHIYYLTKAEQLKNSNPDVIVVTGSPVIFDFYNRYVFPLMPNIPMVGETRSIPENHKPDAYSFIKYEQNFQTTIDLALDIQKPEAVYLIGDATHPGSRLSMDTLENGLADKASPEVHRLDMPFDELIKQVKKLPKNSVGFFCLIFSDGKGARMIPEKALQLIADEAPFPIFAFHETMVGSGATGGVVAKGEDVGIQMIKEGLVSLKDGPFNPPRVVPAVSTLLFDGTYMDKYKIAVDKLPADAEIINITPNILENYFTEILIGILVIIIQAILLASLFFYSRQKKLLSIELEAVNEELEQRVDDRTQSLKTMNEELHRKSAEITDLMHTDAVTGIANRRHFETEFDREFKRSRRSESELSMAICDVDNFKTINDSFGHDVGDKVLIKIAQSMSGILRETDLVARWGGDEFVILFIDSDVFLAEQISQRVMRGVSDLEFEEIEQIVTISMGITKMIEGDESSDMMKRADRALYESKMNGRNKISIK